MTAPDEAGSVRRSYGPEFLTDLFRNPLDPGYADAAARRAEVGPRTGWRREGLRIACVVTMFLIGLLLVVAYRQTVADEPGRSRARAGLVDQVNERQRITDDLQRRADQLRDEVARQRAAVLPGSDVARLRDLEAFTGLVRVRGDGVLVRVDDGPQPADPVAGSQEDPDLRRIFDRDLQDITNALWSAGAEAIAINGQRLTSTSTIRRAGSAILVDFRPVSGPYEVTAIGPDDLARRFSDSATARLFRSLASAYGMMFELHEVSDRTLPAAAEPQLRYARSATEPTPGSTPSPAPNRRPSADASADPTGGPSGRPTPRPTGPTPSTSPSGGGQ